MLMDCKKCGRNFIPAKKSIKNCDRCRKIKNQTNQDFDNDEEELEVDDDSTSQTLSTINEKDDDDQVVKMVINNTSEYLMCGHVEVNDDDIPKSIVKYDDDDEKPRPTIKEQLSELNKKLNAILCSINLNDDDEPSSNDEDTITNRITALLNKTDKICAGINNKMNADILQILKEMNNKIDVNSSMLEKPKALI